MLNCRIIHTRKKLTIRFAKNKKEKDKSVICCVKDNISSQYTKPKVSEHSKHIDLVIPEGKRRIFGFVEIFVKDIVLPYAQKSCSCDECNRKKRPSFCPQNKAVT